MANKIVKANKNTTRHAKVFLIVWGEIGTKGKNKQQFIKILANNIIAHINKHNQFSNLTPILRRISGRLELSFKQDLNNDFTQNLVDILSKIFGIKHFMIANQYPLIKSSESSKPDIDHIIEYIVKEIIEFISSTFTKHNVVNTDALTSKISINIRRLDKSLEFKSQDVNKALLAQLSKKYPMVYRSLDYKSQYKIYVEIDKKFFYIYDTKSKFKGIAGLPVSSSGRVICLVSGGIDSAVASYLMMKRGCDIILLHFAHQEDYTKIEKLKEVLEKYHPKTIKLIVVPSRKIEKIVVSNINERYRMLVLRRIFVDIAEKLAYKLRAKAIVLGDNLGQVASQTLENLACLDYNIALPLIRPLICYDKEEIISLAKNIGTYDISIQPYQDCCSLIVSRHPKTKTTLIAFSKEYGKIKPLLKDIIKQVIEKVS